MTASSPARPRRRGLRWIASLAVAAILVAAPVAATAATTPTPTPDAEGAGTVSVTLSPVSGGLVQQGGFSAVVAVENGTAATLPAATLRLGLGDTALASRAETATWASTPDDRALAAAGETTIGAVGPGERVTWSVSLSASDPLLADRAPGVYPLLATYRDGGAAVTSASTLVVADDESTPATIGVIVPITAPPRTTGLITSDELAQFTAADGTLTQQLDGVDGTGAILAIDPAIAASIRVLGDTAPKTASAWLDRLLALPNDRFAQQFGDADVAAQLHSAVGMLLQPASFVAQLDPADFPPATPTATPNPTATADPTADLPTLDDLLDVGATLDAPLFWPATGTADAEVVARLAALDADALTVVASDTTAAGADGATVPARGDGGVLVADSLLSTALDTASRTDDPIAREAVLAQVTAQLAFAAPDAAGAPLLVTTDRADARSRVALRDAISAITGAPGVSTAGLDDLASAAPQAVEVTGGASSTARADAVDGLVDREQQIERFASVLDDPQLLTAPERAAVLQVLGVGWLQSDGGWQQAVAVHRDATQATLESVSIPPPTDVNLLTANSRLQFTVRNELPWPVTVRLTAQPDDPRLRVQQMTTVEAGAVADTRVVVPVDARIGSGDVTIALQLRSLSGVPIGAPDTVDVRVRAEWETAGITVLAVLVGGLLVLGIIRTVRRRRTVRAGAADTD